MLSDRPSVAPKDQLDDIINYLRYAARFAPPCDEVQTDSTPKWYWLMIVFLSLTATLAGHAFVMWIVLRSLGWL